MSRIILILILTFSAFATAAPGGATACGADLASGAVPALATTFLEAYLKEGSVYRAGQCGRNVKELLLHLEERGFAAGEAKVLFLLNEIRRYTGGPFLPGPLAPARNRRHAGSWDFHVILRYPDPQTGGEFILDLDGASVPVPVAVYFKTMFPSRAGEDRLAKISLREIDAPGYLRAFTRYHETRDPRLSADDNYVVGDFRAPGLKSYPVTTLREYLSR